MLSRGGSRGQLDRSDDAGGKGEALLAHLLEDRAVDVAAWEVVVPIHEGDGSEPQVAAAACVAVAPHGTVPGGRNTRSFHITPICSLAPAGAERELKGREAHGLLGCGRHHESAFTRR